MVIEELLESHDYARHWAETYFDAFVPVSVQKRPPFANGPIAWLERSLDSGMGYDAIVRRMLTAEGTLREHGEGAFLAAQLRAGRVEGVTGVTIETFLGLEGFRCAQCHDHPWADIEQKTFEETAAYFARLRVTPDGKGDARTLRVSEAERGEFRGSGGPVAPRFLGVDWPVREGEMRRETLARALTDSDRFAETTVDHVWERLFGSELGGAGASARSLLAADLREHGYDHRRLVRTIVSSSAYQRSARTGPADPDQARRAFAQARIRTLPPRTLFRTLMQATSVDPDQPHVMPETETARHMMNNEHRFQLGIHAEDPHSTTEDRLRSTTPEALMLLNDWLVNASVRSRPTSRLADLFERHEDTGERLEELYLALFSRLPTPAERQRDTDRLKNANDKAWEDLLYSMVVSTEFVTNH